jgi:hypothetical protein
VLDIKLYNSIKLRLNDSSIYYSVSRALNLLYLDTLDLRVSRTEALGLLFANWS